VAAEADDFGLSGLHFAAGLYGSAVLAFAVQRGALDAAEAFDLSRLDEAFQEERWGVDSEAAARVAALRTEAEMIGRWFEALWG
jgi:chaperone required for assembly of F1-ATPase